MIAVAACEAFAAMTISTEERNFFVAMGERIALLRRATNISQVQLDEAMGVSQQTLQSYGVGRRRIPVSMLQALGKALSVHIDALLSNESVQAKRAPARKLQQHRERISALPRAKQKFVMEVLESVLALQAR